MSRQRVPNVELARDTARSNLLTNGGFEIWQRGNGPFTAGSAYTADRWQVVVGGVTYSAVRDTVNISGLSGAAMAITVTGGSGSGSGSSAAIVQQTVENSTLFRGQALSLSIRMRGSAAANFQFGWYDGSIWNMQPQQAVTTSYTTYSWTFTPGGSTNPLYLAFWLQGTATYYLDNAMLVVGSVAADYAPLHPADDLACCQRYWQRFTLTSRLWYGSLGVTHELIVPMRAITATTPRVTITPGSRSNIQASYPVARIVAAENVIYSYNAAAVGDAYAVNEVYVLEANP